jgi:DinB superfamily
MNRTIYAAALLTLALPLVANTQAPGGQAAPSGPAAETLASYSRLKPNILKAADKMPEDAYQFKPTPEERPFARVLNHVTEAQLQTCSALNGGTFDKTKVPADTASKADIIAGLKLSFDECDKAYGALTDANILEQITPRKRTRMSMAWGNISHDNEQYAELSGYMRLKGVNPPTAPEK